MDLRPHLARIAEGETLSRDEAHDAFETIMSGGATPSQIGAFLMGLRQRGETVDEIVGAVSVMRAKMLPVEAPADAIDIVGTGGDGSGSYNVSTCAAIVAAAAGATVAKHGNRALSSKSGAADTLEALGVNIELDPDGISRCIHEAGVGFMFAPIHHSAMRHVGPSRKEMGLRTIFNLLGPLSNPAGVRRQVIGVYAPDWVQPLAHVLRDLGSEHAMVVHGDGLDELTVTGETGFAELKGGSVAIGTVDPESVGIGRHPMSALKGGDARRNAEALRDVLAGQASAYRDIACLNAGASLVVANVANDLSEGVERAAAAIDDGRARDTLDRLVAVSNAGAA